MSETTPPATDAAPQPPPPDYPTATSSAQATTAAPPPTSTLDEDLNRSTQKLLLETMWTAGTYLLYSVGAYIVCRLLKLVVRYPFRLLSWATTWIIYLFERALYWLAWFGQWLSVIAFFAILVFMAGAAVTYALYRFETQLRSFAARRPLVAKLSLEALLHVPVLAAWLVLSPSLYQLVAALALARLAANALGIDWLGTVRTGARNALPSLTGRSRKAGSTQPAQPVRAADLPDDERLRPIREALERAERERSERAAQRERETEEADNWARQLQEQMLREGLTKRAQQQAAASAPNPESPADRGTSVS